MKKLIDNINILMLIVTILLCGIVTGVALTKKEIVPTIALVIIDCIAVYMVYYLYRQNEKLSDTVKGFRIDEIVTNFDEPDIDSSGFDKDGNDV